MGIIVSLAEMKSGDTGMVVELHLGGRRADQLAAMGVRPGVMVTKQSGQPLRGPITFRVGRSELAVGHGLARRILVERPQ